MTETTKRLRWLVPAVIGIVFSGLAPEMALAQEEEAAEPAAEEAAEPEASSESAETEEPAEDSKKKEETPAQE